MNIPVTTPSRDGRPPLDHNPWPGLDSFHEADSFFFRGRREETVDLMQLVLRAQCALLYGVSGIGKSSSLEAGLFPLARENDLFPIRIRLDCSQEDPDYIQQVRDARRERYGNTFTGVDKAFGMATVSCGRS